jgi:hypothetical protein
LTASRCANGSVTTALIVVSTMPATDAGLRIDRIGDTTRYFLRVVR